MKKLITLLGFVLLAAQGEARSDAIMFAWDYPYPTQDIVFNIYMSTNQGTNYSMAATIGGTNLATTLTYTYTGEMWFYCTASNSVRRLQSAPSNVVKVPGVPQVPPNFRLISITIGP